MAADDSEFERIERELRVIRKADPGLFRRIYEQFSGSYLSVARPADVERLIAALSAPAKKAIAAGEAAAAAAAAAAAPAKKAVAPGEALAPAATVLPLPYDRASVRMVATSDPERHQVQKFRKKEIETQRWIEGFEAGDVFFDIGANIGLFSVLAAVQPDKNIRVFSFEPSYSSFHSLCENLRLNDLGRAVTPFLCAISDVTGTDTFNFWRIEAGTAKSVVGEAIDYRNRAFTPAAVQQVPVIALDRAIEVYGLPVPNHIKVDVDGIEFKVLAGAAATLRRPELRSIMVEASDAAEEERLLELFAGYGLHLRERQDKSLDGGGTRNNYFHRVAS